MDSAAGTGPGSRPYLYRLEATWACFFERLGWRVEDRPPTLNGWIPSFAIQGEGVTTLADVRPMKTLSPIVAANMLCASDWVPIHAHRSDSPKAIAHSVLLLGESPLVPLDSAPAARTKGRASLGWIHDGIDAVGVYEGGSNAWQIAYLLYLPDASPQIGFSGLSGNWMDRISGVHFNMMTDNVTYAVREDIEALWRDCEAATAKDYP